MSLSSFPEDEEGVNMYGEMDELRPGKVKSALKPTQGQFFISVAALGPSRTKVTRRSRVAQRSLRR